MKTNVDPDAYTRNLIAPRIPIVTLCVAAMIVASLSGSSRTIADDLPVIDLENLAGREFRATDSLQVDAITLATDETDDVKECLDGLCWQPTEFVVTCEKSPRSDRGDILIRFPSPIASGVEGNDRVAMEWYVARDEEQVPVAARSVVVVHESGSGMTVGRMFARGLRAQGLHAFLIHLPHYGERRATKKRPANVDFITMMHQAITDVRRARDVVAVLPGVDMSHIALQGTSLGGFVSATTACLDRGYDSVFLMLAGGELYDLLQNGEKDAAKVREKLAEAGLSGERLRSLAWKIEPTRVAHRLDPQRTWLYSGSFDRVVPLKNAIALAKAASLEPEHHIQLLANHYTGIVYLPFVLDHIRTQIDAIDPVADAVATPPQESPISDVIREK